MIDGSVGVDIGRRSKEGIPKSRANIPETTRNISEQRGYEVGRGD